MLLPGFTPVVKVQGRDAAVRAADSDETMLVAVALPPDWNPLPRAAISVDNGNGSGPAELDRPVEIAAGSGDPYGLGVGWTGAFTPIAAKVVPVKVAADGATDDSAAILDAIEKTAASGGGNRATAGGNDQDRQNGVAEIEGRAAGRRQGQDHPALREIKLSDLGLGL